MRSIVPVVSDPHIWMVVALTSSLTFVFQCAIYIWENYLDRDWQHLRRPMTATELLSGWAIYSVLLLFLSMLFGIVLCLACRYCSHC